MHLETIFNNMLNIDKYKNLYEKLELYYDQYYFPQIS